MAEAGLRGNCKARERGLILTDSSRREQRRKNNECSTGRHANHQQSTTLRRRTKWSSSLRSIWEQKTKMQCSDKIGERSLTKMDVHDRNVDKEWAAISSQQCLACLIVCSAFFSPPATWRWDDLRCSWLCAPHRLAVMCVSMDTAFHSSIL